MGCGLVGAWSRSEDPAWPQGQVGLGLQERTSLCGLAFFSSLLILLSYFLNFKAHLSGHGRLGETGELAGMGFPSLPQPVRRQLPGDCSPPGPGY